MGVHLYVGINETKWNHHPVDPGPLACISPVYGASKRTKTKNSVRVPSKVEVLQDSGAFCDGPGDRLDFQSAYERQVAHSKEYKYADQVTHMASYDLLIDEKWQDGMRHKERWTESDARAAVEETCAAAKWIRAHRADPVILSAQGVTARQYLGCTKNIVPLIRPGDILGLGGWCIIGKMPKRMMPAFRETISTVIPYAAQQGIEWVHIWGVVYAPALGELLWLCNEHGIKLSTDSSGPQVRPARGTWGYMGWTDRNYCRPPVETRGLERARHVRATRRWLSSLEDTKFYKPPVVQSPSLGG